MKIKNPPIIIDSTVIGRYGLTNQFDILKQLYGKFIVIPTPVIIESINCSPLEKCVRDAISAKWMEEYSLQYSSESAELKEYLNLRRRFGDGESAVLAIAKNWRCTVASDDLRAARAYCEKHGLDLIGSLGILYSAYSEKIKPDFKDCDKLLSDMITKTNYKSPVSTFQEVVVNWFEKGIGTKLY